MAKKLPPALRRYMAEIGRKGGKRSAAAQTAEERSLKARRAALARWRKES